MKHPLSKPLIHPIGMQIRGIDGSKRLSIWTCSVLQKSTRRDLGAMREAEGWREGGGGYGAYVRYHSWGWERMGKEARSNQRTALGILREACEGIGDVRENGWRGKRVNGGAHLADSEIAKDWRGRGEV